MTSDMNLAKSRIPWPGPRPYEEQDWDDFFGRDPDIMELLDRVRVNKLTILFGGSGSGKTSLIRAGVVPLLRQERYHPQGDQTEWPVLLLRRWGNVGSSSLDENLVFQLGWAIDAIRDWGERLNQEKAIADSQALNADLSPFRSPGLGKTTVLDAIEALARSQALRSAAGERRGGLILIFDQFEEQLRASLQAKAQALELIGNLARSGAPTRVLLSMRREFQHALRPLESIVGSLSGRSYFLESLPQPTVVDIIRASSEKSNIPIDSCVAERIVQWLAPGLRKEERRVAPSIIEYPEGEEPDLHDEGGQPDLLRLQAVLLELSRYALGRRQDRLTMELFDEFSLEFGESRTSGHSPQNEELSGGATAERMLSQRVLGGALERWIESALLNETREDTRNSTSVVSSGSLAEWTGMKSEDLRLQVRRIAARVAPLLSSGDYKVSQEENSLFRQALGEEIARLGLKGPELRSRVRMIEVPDGPPHLNWDEFDVSGDNHNRQDRILSGLARVEKWSPEETGDRILACFKETLHRLAMANILQYTAFGVDKVRYWELVHDQLGPSFAKWALRQRGTWDDCKSSLVVCSGLQPIEVLVSEIKPLPGNEFYDLVKVSWQGCSIENSRSMRLTLRNVRFRECYLLGTIFDAIDFVGCLFERCELKGSLFRRCTFKADDNGRSTVFDGCDANFAIVGGAISDLEFRNCHLLQPVINGALLTGDIRYTDGSRVIQGYFDLLRTDGASKGRISFDGRSRAALCLSDSESHSLLKFENQDLDIRNSPLVDDLKVRS